MFNMYELNKIIGAGLFSILVILGLGILSDTIFDVEAPEKPGFLVEVESDEPNEAVPESAADTEAAEEVTLASILAAGEFEKGQKIAKKCAACHSFDEGGPNKVGPNLHGIVGRDVASMSGFAYSSAMKEFGGTWTYQRLFDFLTKPKDLVPGTIMGFSGLKKPNQRADLIAFLKSISPNAPALSE